MSHMRGEPVVFDVTSADLSTAIALPIRNPGTATVRTLLATERLVITHVHAVLASGASPTRIVADVDSDHDIDTNDVIVVLGTGNNNVDLSGTPDQGIAGKLGNIPYIKAAASGQIDVVGIGYIIKS